jgi:hypothetical protein
MKLCMLSGRFRPLDPKKPLSADDWEAVLNALEDREWRLKRNQELHERLKELCVVPPPHPYLGMPNPVITGIGREVR